ncbi:hypothetical protein SAMN05444959_1343 [Paracoccus seriniphilus]|uniref:Uncharacterized protein n=1 Tax=Paracoccus seriniphilus TaxID=184748 RepID=A0A239Q305_9RHOB|nr:hypothetical protein SAMN05444959_1343 [Paracoccus seriniphilus]
MQQKLPYLHQEPPIIAKASVFATSISRPIQDCV